MKIAEKRRSAVKVSQKYQITLPDEAFKKLGIKSGDFLDARVQDDALILVPSKLVPRDQAWFWSPEWQRGEREADEDIVDGRLSGPFASVAALKKALKKRG